MPTRQEILNERYTKVVERLEKYEAAEIAILDGAQSYSIGNRTLSRAELNTITKQIERLKKEQLKLLNYGAVRLQRVVPRDI